jgi:Mg2+ and Co2+ transporter CorA
VVRSALAATNYPRVSRLGGTFVFSGSLPMVNERDPNQIDVQTAPFAFLCTNKSFLLAQSHPSIGIALGELLKEKHLLPEQPLHSRLALGLFSLMIARYEEVADRMASDVRRLMMLPMGRHEDQAYVAGFSLQRSLARMKSDMWRLGQIFDRLEKGRLTLPFEGGNFMAMYEGYSDACDFTSEAFSQSHDAASSTIDLRINLASFQMNRFMGLLAVATAIGIIPATLSGFLGMNIQGTDFPVTLGNVAFWAVMLVVLALYFLKTRGWLRF